jgi:hypothetical protein
VQRRTPQPALLDIYDGTVDPRRLAIWLPGVVAAGLVVFVLANLWLLRLADPEIARGYALLAGLLAVVLGGALSARYIPPRRTVTEEPLDVDSARAAMGELSTVVGGSLDPAVAPESVLAEMRAAGIGELTAPDVQR